eukprot:m.294375 g.294375  ORF g.294375 m.294375 type:complete len:82 (-) comp20032_c0_seq2:1747-1992(-)
MVRTYASGLIPIPRTLLFSGFVTALSWLKLVWFQQVGIFRLRLKLGNTSNKHQSYVCVVHPPDTAAQLFSTGNKLIHAMSM